MNIKNMQDFQPLLVCDNEEEILPHAKTELTLDFAELKQDDFGFDANQTLEYLAFQLLKKPTALAVHVQRIYFCCRHNLSEQLFAAFVDFLIILNGKGQSLSFRLIKGAKSKLHAEEYAILNKALNLSNEELKLLSGNMYSLFTLGLIGTTRLIEKEQAPQQEFDPLDIARDFIAYSQLDAAMDTLEEAVLHDMERQELHEELLELYKVTQSFERFDKMYKVLSVKIKTIPADWEELKGFFNEG